MKIYRERDVINLLTGKQRSALKSMANTLRPTVVIGKNGITEAVVKDIDNQLAVNELVKINILDTNGLEADETAHDLADVLEAEFVSALGSKMVLYRPSEEEKIQLPNE